MNSLVNLRNEINAIDDQLQALFIKRMNCAKGVAAAKLVTDDDISKPEREKELKTRLLSTIPSEFSHEYEAFLDTMLRVSRKHQYGIVCQNKPEKLALPHKKADEIATDIYYQGIKGSYSYEASNRLFPNVNYHNKDYFSDVFSAISKDSDRAVIPFENSFAGVVSDVKNLLCHKDLYISTVFNKKIINCLCAKNELDYSKPIYVHSHSQPISQCKSFIRQHNLIPITEINTAIAAKKIADGNFENHAVICSAGAAKIYGLNILEQGINDIDENITRFAVLSNSLTVSENDTHTAIVFSTSHKSGALSFALSLFSDYGINLTTLHSEPSEDTAFEYLFFAEFEGNALSLPVRSLLYQLSKELSYMKILGSYEVLQDEN